MHLANTLTHSPTRHSLTHMMTCWDWFCCCFLQIVCMLSYCAEICQIQKSGRTFCWSRICRKWLECQIWSSDWCGSEVDLPQNWVIFHCRIWAVRRTQSVSACFSCVKSFVLVAWISRTLSPRNSPRACAGRSESLPLNWRTSSAEAPSPTRRNSRSFRSFSESSFVSRRFCHFAVSLQVAWK